MLLSLMACADDDNNNVQTYNGSMVGTWKLVEITYYDGDDVTYDTSSCEGDNLQGPHISMVFSGTEVESFYTCAPDIEHFDYYTYSFSNGVINFNGEDYLKANVTDLGNNRIAFKYITHDDNTDYNGPYMVLEKQ